MSDGFDQDFLSSLHGMTSRNQGSRADQQMIAELQQQNDLLRQRNADLQPKGPPCPFCGGDLPMVDAALCKHCRSELSWFKGYVCKPGEEHLVEGRMAKIIQRQKDYEAELLATLSIARENYRELKGKHFRAMVLSLIVLAVCCLFYSLQSYVLALFFFVAFCGAITGLAVPRIQEMQELESKYGKERLQ